MTATTKPIRVGVVGIGRGQSFARAATDQVGLKLVALCDTWETRLREVGRQYGVATYTDYDAYLAHDLDAVVLANYFHEHAPLAIKALRAGRHVMSETAACKTLAEGVALCRAVAASGRIYMLAENYPFTKFNLELRRLYRAGEIGRVLYAEGEYNHPMSPATLFELSPGLNHWRNWLPATYYCTHALAPLVYITDTQPVAVNGLAVAAPEVKPSVWRGDPTGVMLVRMDNGAVFRIFGLITPGHSCWWRLHGTAGAMESTRGPGYFGPEGVRVWHEAWQTADGQASDRVWQPDWPEHGDLANAGGHGGGDFWTNLLFAEAIRSGHQPFLDVYRAVAMSVVGVQGWKSALANGAPFVVPDFRDEAARRPHENDHWSPFPADAGPGQPPCAISGTGEPATADVAAARAVWARQGSPAA